MQDPRPTQILTLDGGGSKGVYTLGVLAELEAYWGQSLSARFDMIYGTSTGAIIAALLGTGRTATEAADEYFKLIPQVMRNWTRKGRSASLRKAAIGIFGEARFDAFSTRIGIVAANYERQRPMIFKSDVDQMYALKSTALPGFGCTIVDALMASSAAFPFFTRPKIKTQNQGEQETIDGGYVANNPTLLAVADAHAALGIPVENMSVLSVGVGHYKEPSKNPLHRWIFRQWEYQLIQKQLGMSTNTIEILRKILLPELKCVRIDDAYPDDLYATDLLEASEGKLRKLYALGRESFAEHEKNIGLLFPRAVRGEHSA